MYLQCALQGRCTVSVQSFDMAVLTAFEIAVYLTPLAQTDGMGKDNNLKSHRTYKVG